MVHQNYVNSYEQFLSLPSNTKDMEFQTGEDDNHAWKLHIFLDQEKLTVSNPIVKDTVKYLMDENISFKMGNGGDGGKVFTIYVGEYDRAQFVAKQLNDQFGDRYKKDFPQGGVKLPEDMHVFNNIGMRFEGVKDNWNVQNKDSAFSDYGHQGVPTFRKFIIRGIKDEKLSSLACHIFLAEKCGAKYLGENYNQNPWANKIFEDLPKKYTYEEVQGYVSDALNILRSLHQERFIYDKNRVSSEQGVSLSIDDIIPTFKQSSLNKEINVSVKNLEIMPNADKITIRKNEYGNDILEYKKGDKILASCSLNGEEHCVRLYSDDGLFTEYMTSPNKKTKRIKDDTLYPITDSYLEARIDSIASLSKALGDSHLKSKNMSEDGLIEEEKQQVAMKGMGNKLVELRGLGKEKKGPPVKTTLTSNNLPSNNIMVNKMIENKSKQPPS